MPALDYNTLQKSFINFDVVDFYPSITEELLTRALDFAGEHTTITEEDRQIILHTKRPLLYNNNIPWTKKSSDFDVAMGSFDGAEVCELVGLFMLDQLQSIQGIDFGLYRDDGLGCSSLTARQTDRIQAKVKKIFEDNNLKITMEVNMQVVNFLDVTMDLKHDTFRPYMKPNNTIQYIHTQSNHPQTVLKQIPLAVNKRLSTISASEQEFNRAAPPYQAALDKSGFNHQLAFAPPEPRNPRRRCRTRRVTWFNPPYSLHVSTNVGRKFLQLVDTCFPPDHPLHNLINRNTVKISYRTMPNMGQVVQRHNARLTRPVQEVVEAGCNCRGGPGTCPLGGRCLTESMIYGAKVTREDTGVEKTYTGLAGGTFKKRFGGHASDFKHRTNGGTTLSTYKWKLHDKDIPHAISWDILARASTYNTTTKM